MRLLDNKEKLYDFLREMEFNRLLSQVISRYGETFEQKVKNLKKTPIFDLKKYQTILKINQLEEWIKKIEEKGIVAVDTETSSLNPHEANLVGISLCSGPGTACYIPLEHITEKVLEKKIVLKKFYYFHYILSIQQLLPLQASMIWRGMKI